MIRIGTSAILLFSVILLTSAGKKPGSLSQNHEATHQHPQDGADNGRREAASCPFAHNKRGGKAFIPKREKREDVTCDSTYLYRSLDGTCNNLDNPTWGSAGQTFQRLLDPVYDDGLGLPRLKQTDGEDLPSARDISVQVHDFDVSRPQPQGSVMLMEWGQFLAHDLTGTPTDDDGLTEDCCYDDLVTGSSLHPDVETGGPCHPIIISEDDRYFTEVSTRCMEFVRSYPVEDASGIRQQMNALSAYIDGTNIYGKSDEEMAALRTYTDGKLKEYDGTEDLPESDTNTCIITDSSATDYCLEAGDDRVNVFPGLGALHTIFMRYHNYVAEQLLAAHSEYDDETLFQEARKIVIAVLQRITYNEYLNMVLSDTTISDYGLQDTWAYDASVDATLYNVFATSAFRFGHSMVPDNVWIDSANVSLVDLYLRPYHVLNNLDSLLEGLVTKSAENADRWYSEGLTDQLFEVEAQDGYDVASLNIQRGRDHGLPPYNDWRELCGLSRHESFDDMHSTRVYQNGYADVDDVDIYSGGLSEFPSAGVVGDTNQCLLAMQFKNLRNGDRFWWENEDTDVGFANARARNQIKKIRLSHVICLTTGITDIQKNVLKIVNDSNAVESCDDLLANSMDYSKM